MQWLKKLFSTSTSPGTQEEKGGAASWLGADAPGNPFGVRVVNLMENLKLTSTSASPDIAARCVSWRPGQQERLGVTRGGQEVPCDLSYPTGAILPDGMLFIPRAMEDKWVIAWRDGAVVFSRSWTGETEITADAYVDNGLLRLTRLYANETSLGLFGNLDVVVDWMMRSHALGERVPLPVDKKVAEFLLDSPLMAMSAFGHRLFCAGVDYRLQAPTSRLYSDGDLAAAAYDNDADAIRKLATEDAWRTPTTASGAPPLVLASQLGHTDLCRLMLELGAEVDGKNGAGGTALQLGVAGRHGREHAALFLDAGAELETANDDGFTSLHAAAEVDDSDMVRDLTERGAKIDSRTKLGYCPIHIAAGLGHRDAAEVLVACGADPNVPGKGKTSAQIAREEGKHDLAEWFESLAV